VRTLVVVGAVVAALAGAGAIAASGGGAGRGAPPASGDASGRAACAATVDATLRAVAARVYAQAASGANVVSAQRRLARSGGLARAVESGDAAATRAALRPLLRSQVHRIVVTRGGRVLARFGGAPALAPVRGVIRDAARRPIGRYMLAVADDAALAGIVRAITGAPVRILGVRRPTPPGAIASLAANAFPSGALRLWLLEPPAATCGATRSATVVAIAERLYRAEAAGPATRRVLRHVADDRRFAAAVAHDDRAALRAAIVRFFRTPSLHVVRVRATTADGRIINDVGGPFVLAPASTAVRLGGRIVGRVTLSIQDDAGYMKLVRRFTGAAVALRTAAGIVPGSAPGAAPAFAATAFPRGRLTVGLAL
jgi:hypothetical protein